MFVRELRAILLNLCSGFWIIIQMTITLLIINFIIVAVLLQIKTLAHVPIFVNIFCRQTVGFF